MDSASLKSSNKANRGSRQAKQSSSTNPQPAKLSLSNNKSPDRSNGHSKGRSSPAVEHFDPRVSRPNLQSDQNRPTLSVNRHGPQLYNQSNDQPDTPLIANYHSVDINSESPESNERSALIDQDQPAQSTNRSIKRSFHRSVKQSLFDSCFKSLDMDGIWVDKNPHSPYHETDQHDSHNRARSPFDEHLLTQSSHQPINQSMKHYLLFGFCSTLLILAVVIPVSVYFIQSKGPKVPPPFSPVITCDIFCTGPVLTLIQMSGIFNDSKTFVDLPLKADPGTVMDAFKALPNHDLSTIVHFVDDYFDSTASDVLSWNISDWTPSPKLIHRLSDRTFSDFATELNALWFVLGREISPDVYKHPERHTLLPLKHPYMVVPGGRFREFYYWDSYWIVRGLLLCDMVDTARMIVENLADLVDKFGFIPNGSRQYYLTRSQPPFLAYMVDIVYQQTQNKTWLGGMLPSLDKEYNFWMTIGGHAVNVTDKHNTSHVVNRYFADVQYPRPESFFEDVVTASELLDHATDQAIAHEIDEAINQSNNHEATTRFHWLTGNTSSMWPEKAKHLFSELTATAETGWDFSSRWFADRTNISSAETSDIIPVDLNAIMYGMEMILSRLHADLYRDGPLVEFYANASHARQKAIHALLFDQSSEHDHYIWRDYSIKTKGVFGGIGILSNWLPLWTRAFDPLLVDENRVVQGLVDSNLIQAGGLLTTENDIRQQWDCPNAWPPLQHMIMEALSFSKFDSNDKKVSLALTELYHSYHLETIPSAYSAVGALSGTHQARALSFFLSSQWTISNLDTFFEQGYMFEKYNAFTRDAGHGGEYTVQAGFGWSNGVNLIFLDQYAPVLNYSKLINQSWPLPATLPPDKVCTSEPKPASFSLMSVRKQAEIFQRQHHMTFQ